MQLDPPDWLLFIHAGAGLFALLLAPLAMVARKGGNWHRFWGKTFVGSMIVLSVTAIPMSFYQPNSVLLLLLLLSTYMSVNGWRAFARKSASRVFDWIAVSTMLVASVGIACGSALLEAPETALVTAMLCGLSIFVAIGDAQGLVKPATDASARWFAHMRSMLGAYVLTVMVYSVLNFEFMPLFWRCAWPLVVGGVLIGLWIGYYRRKFAQNETGKGS